MAGPELKDDSVTIYIWGKPQGKERPRFNFHTGHAYTAAKTRNAEKMIWAEAQKVLGRAPKPYFNKKVPLHVDTFFVFQKPKKTEFGFPVKQDLDNLEKTVWDALNGVVYADDRQIVSSFKDKRYAQDGIEYTRITIRRRFYP